jgi:hypothetical protein
LLHARPWTELTTLLQAPDLGYLQLLTPNTDSPIYPIHPGDSLTLGRSRDNDITISETATHVSRFHARLEVQAQAVRLYDQQSSRGTYVQRQADGDKGHLRRVDKELGLLLQEGDTIFLAHPTDTGHCRLLFTLYAQPLGRDLPTAVTG